MHLQYLPSQNLELLFGKELFDDYIYLPCGADKDKELKKYEGTECFWVEDKVENAEVGKGFGLNSILVAHEHNAYYEGDIPRYWKWKDIYKHITGEV